MIINEYGKPEDKKNLSILEKEIRDSMKLHEPDLLRGKISQIDGLRYRILRDQPGFWVGWFEQLEEMKADMRDQSEAEQLFSKGRRAINNNDLDGLQATVNQLISLLPANQQQVARGYGGGTIK